MTAIMGKIDEFKFEINRVAYDQLEHTWAFGWSNSERLSNHPYHQAVGQWNHEISLSGELLLKKQSGLDELILLAQQKEPVVLVVGSEGIIGKVIILSINLNDSNFLHDGLYLRRRFSFKLTRYYE